MPTHRLTWFTHLPALHLSKLSTDISVDPTVDLTNGPSLCVSQTNLTTSYPIPSCSIPFFYLFQPRSIHTPITLFPPPLSLFALVSFLAPPALRSYPNLSHYIQSAVSIHVYPTYDTSYTISTTYPVYPTYPNHLSISSISLRRMSRLSHVYLCVRSDPIKLRCLVYPIEPTNPI